MPTEQNPAAQEPQPTPGQQREQDPVPDQWVRRRPTSDEARTDALIAAVMFCLGILALTLFRMVGFYDDPAGPVTSLLCIALGTVPLALRRLYPTLTLFVVAIAMVFIAELEVPETLIINIAVFMAIYTVGAWSRDRRRAVRVQTVVVVAMLLWLFSAFLRETLSVEEDVLAGEMTPALAYWLYQLLINLLYFAGAVWFGHHAWGKARTEARLEEQTEALQAERAVVASQAVSLERLRIARELHDSVAHHVSLMGVQAGAARTLLKTDAAAAEDFIRQIESSARSSVSEMQSILGVLRDGSAEAEEPVSALGIDQIDDLLAAARTAGLETRYEVHGEPKALRPVHSLTLYRIAQEALTNIRKHAGEGAATDVRLRWRSASVELEILDDGGRRRHHGTAQPSSGHGLPGMRERAAALGGSFDCGPREPTGFFIRVDLPVAEAEAVRAGVRPASGAGADEAGRDESGGVS